MHKIYAAPGNGGIREQAELVPLNADDVAGPLEFAEAKAIDLTFVGPEIPLSKGIVPWPDVFARLRDLKFNGWISIHSEYANLGARQVIEQTGQDLGYLREVVGLA